MKFEFIDLEGPFIEVAGPTKGGYNTVDPDKLPEKIFVSNIFCGSPLFGALKGQYYGQVDFMASGYELPFSDCSLGAVLCSRLGAPHIRDRKLQRRLAAKSCDKKALKKEKDRQRLALRAKTALEVIRVLRPGGIFFWEHINKRNVNFAKKIGFTVIYEFRRGRTHHVILQKTKKMRTA